MGVDYTRSLGEELQRLIGEFIRPSFDDSPPVVQLSRFARRREGPIVRICLLRLTGEKHLLVRGFKVPRGG